MPELYNLIQRPSTALTEPERAQIADALGSIRAALGRIEAAAERGSPARSGATHAIRRVRSLASAVGADVSAAAREPKGYPPSSLRVIFKICVFNAIGDRRVSARVRDRARRVDEALRGLAQA